MAQWLRLDTPEVGILDLIPGQGTRPENENQRTHVLRPGSTR